jgi:KUP system potassium uptake protein
MPKDALTLEANGEGRLEWWIDTSFAVHPDMWSHTGVAMSMGKGCPISSSTRQKINTKSSTEAELVGVDDGMPFITWARNFLKHQGVAVNDNVVYQDNQSAILLEKNGRASSGRQTRHINIRYFFVTDRVKNGELRIEYCPTDEMLADFFTKPLQGSLFHRLRAQIMNLGENTQPLAILTDSQECVGMQSWSNVVRGTNKSLNQPHHPNQPIRSHTIQSFTRQPIRSHAIQHVLVRNEM